jgi:hypothetical protein
MKKTLKTHFISVSNYYFTNVKEIGLLENFRIVFSPRYLKTKSKQSRIVKVKIK